jgi:hypothetical protein
MSEPAFYRHDLSRYGAGATQAASDPRSERIERLIDRIPWPRLRSTARWLRRPSSRWVRFPAAVLLMIGGLLSFLPILGLWMLPLGLVLLAEDVPAVRRLMDRVLDWIERRRPHWFAPPRSSSPRQH